MLGSAPPSSENTGRPLMPVPAGVAGVAALLLIVVAVGALGPKRTGDDGPAAAATLTSSVALSQTGASLATSPTSETHSAPSAEPTATSGAGWTPIPDPTPAPGVILESDGVLSSPSWSPAGGRLALVEMAPDREPEAKILDRAGTVVEAFPAEEFAWLDEDTYVALAGSGKANDFVVVTGTVGSASRRPIAGSYSKIVPGRGAAALQVDGLQGGWYVVVTTAGVSERRDGVPLAFSPDGSTLAVVRYPTPSKATGSSGLVASSGPPRLVVVRADTGSTLATSDDIEWGGPGSVAFSPDGGLIALMMSSGLDARGKAGLLDIVTGQRWVFLETLDGSVPPDQIDVEPFLWTGPDQLVVRAWRSGSAQAGTPVDVTYGNVVGTLSSAGVLARLSDDGRSVLVFGPAKVTPIPLPLSPWNHQPMKLSDLEWSPDGSTLVALCLDDAFAPGTVEVVVLT